MTSTRFTRDDGTIERARALRRNSTAPEMRLWSVLRGSALAGAKFRRQQRIGLYVVDFACQAARLVIEVDGDTHATPDALAHDGKRTAFLNGEGYRVLRFSNADVMENLGGVAATITAHLTPSPSHAATRRGPLPLPQGERDQ